MKYIKLMSLAVLFLLVTLVNAYPFERVHPSKLNYKELKMTPPVPEKVVLENGITIFALEDHELPVVTINAAIRTGAIYEPEELTGLARITGTVMRIGGTQSMKPEEINDELDFIAASIGTSIGNDAGFAHLSVLKKDIDPCLKVFADILMKPSFDRGKVDFAKRQMIESIRRENDNPASVANRELKHLLYRDHPYGREATIETVSRITRSDLLDFHKKYFHPNNIIIGITGDFDKDEMIEKIRLVFKDWKKGEVTFPYVPSVKRDISKSVNYIYKDIEQSYIRLGHMGININNPDHYAVILMNYILGGGNFQSRMMKDIRVDKGLAYSVWSDFQIGKSDIGIFASGASTKLTSTITVIENIEGIIKDMRESYVLDEELMSAKEYFINSFIFNFTSSTQIVNRYIVLAYYGVPSNYLKTYLDNIRKVSKEDILNASKNYLKPDQTVVLVVGNKDKFEKPLENFSSVNVIKLKNYENVVLANLIKYPCSLGNYTLQ